MGSRGVIGSLALIGALGFTVCALLPTRTAKPVVGGSSPPVVRGTAFQQSPQHSSSAARGASNKVHESKSYAKIYAEARNYFPLVHDLLPAAGAGNADAQFALFKALQFCTQVNESYFQMNGRSIGLDEALQNAARWKLSMPLVQSMYDRCHEFQGEDLSQFGKAFEWLEKASEAGQPVAQATLAAQMLQQELMRNFAKTSALSTENSEPTIGNGADPKYLVRASVESRDPEALMNIGWAEALLNQGRSANTEYLAWMLVACQRGLDCSDSSDWVRTRCSHCDSSSPVNLIRSTAGDAWPDVQQRAQDINIKLDAQQWDDLDLS